MLLNLALIFLLQTGCIVNYQESLNEISIIFAIAANGAA